MSSSLKGPISPQKPFSRSVSVFLCIGHKHTEGLNDDVHRIRLNRLMTGVFRHSLISAKCDKLWDIVLFILWENWWSK